jgi:hypothetical protein
MKISEVRRHVSWIRRKINLEWYAITSKNGVFWDESVNRKTTQNIFKAVLKIA